MGERVQMKKKMIWEGESMEGRICLGWRRKEGRVKIGKKGRKSYDGEGREEGIAYVRIRREERKL